MTESAVVRELLFEIWKAKSGDKTVPELISSALTSSYQAGYDAGIQAERLRCLEATLPKDYEEWSHGAIWASNHIRDLIAPESK